MTEEERRKFEQWKESFESKEELYKAIFRSIADPYWYDSPGEERRIKQGYSEEAIEQYYWSVREDEERRERQRREYEEAIRALDEYHAREEAKRRKKTVIDGSVLDADRSPAPTEWQLSERRRLEQERKKEEKRREEERRKREAAEAEARRKAEDEDLLKRYTYEQYKILREALMNEENPYGDSIEDRDEDLSPEMRKLLEIEVERRKKKMISDRQYGQLIEKLRGISVSPTKQYEGDGDPIEDRDEEDMWNNDEESPLKPQKSPREIEDYGDPIDDREEDTSSTETISKSHFRGFKHGGNDGM